MDRDRSLTFIPPFEDEFVRDRGLSGAAIGDSGPDRVTIDAARFPVGPRVRRQDKLLSLVRNCPPWMLSGAIHFMIFLVAAVFLSAITADRTEEVELIFAEQSGEQLIDPNGSPEAHGTEAPVTAPGRPEVADPQASPAAAPSDTAPDAEASSRSSSADEPFITSDVRLPQVGHALQGREVGSRNSILGKYGGNATTEDSVKMALEWLGRQQRRKGNWSLIGPYSDAGTDENEVAATAMAMLAFQGAGHTHQQGDYRAKLTKAKAWLLAAQSSEGSFWKGVGLNNHQLYTHAIATMALCELYGMTGDDKLKKPAQRALDYSVSIQDEEGGWRYDPGIGSDLSVTGWFVMSLQSGRMAGLHVPSPTLMKVHKFLDSVAHEDGATYAYMRNYAPTPAMTAEGLLCRQYLGWDKRDTRMQQGLVYLLDHPISTDAEHRDAYYWYYATQVLHHVGGAPWNEWNTVMRQSIPEMQERKGSEKGSWDPDGYPYGNHAGRLYITCLSTYMLEVYYRHLPLYETVYQ